MDKIPRKDKPESEKLVRQLVCYLFLRYLKQLRLQTILGSDGVSTVTPKALDSARRTYGRYIQEILACLDLSEDTLSEKWYTYYSKGSFYIGDPDEFLFHSGDYFYLEEITHQILPVDPFPEHGERLRRTIRLTDEIISELVRSFDEAVGLYLDPDTPLSQYFRTMFWPRYKTAYRDQLIKEANQHENRVLQLRTAQRDTKAIATAITRFYALQETEERSISLRLHK